MSNLTLTPKWHSDFNQLETGELILGGAVGNINLAPKQLAESLLWLKQQVDKAGPTEAIKVGDIYFTTLNHKSSTAVKAHHGYGTWQRYAEGRTLVGFSTKPSDPDNYKTMGEMFGENEHTLTQPEMPRHSHKKIDYDQIDLNIDRGGDAMHYGDSGSGNVKGIFATGIAGEDQPHNNIQPSIVAQYWVRTA